MYLDEKAPKRPTPRRKTITGEQLYQLRSNMCIFSQLFIVFPFFGHPVWLKHTLKLFIYDHVLGYVNSLWTELAFQKVARKIFKTNFPSRYIYQWNISSIFVQNLSSFHVKSQIICFCTQK